MVPPFTDSVAIFGRLRPNWSAGDLFGLKIFHLVVGRFLGFSGPYVWSLWENLKKIGLLGKIWTFWEN